MVLLEALRHLAFKIPIRLDCHVSILQAIVQLASLTLYREVLRVSGQSDPYQRLSLVAVLHRDTGHFCYFVLFVQIGRLVAIQHGRL